MKAKIKQYGDCLWLEIDGKHDETAWAITEEELLPIRNAIDAYFIKRSQEKAGEQISYPQANESCNSKI